MNVLIWPKSISTFKHCNFFYDLAHCASRTLMKWVHQQLVLGQCHEWFAPQQDDLLVELYTHLKCKLPYLMRCNKNYQYNNNAEMVNEDDDYIL